MGEGTERRGLDSGATEVFDSEATEATEVFELRGH
jgi:hypothetical protein